MAGKGRRRRSDKQILGILAEHQGGVTVQEIIRRHGISLDTCYRWKKTFSGVSKHDVQRLRALEDENARRKAIVADQALNLQVFKDALGTGW
jgi:putative transposase